MYGIRFYGLKRWITRKVWLNIENEDEERKLIRQFWLKVFPFFSLGVLVVGGAIATAWVMTL